MIKHSLFKKIDGRSIELLISLSGTRVSATLMYFQQGAEPQKLSEDTKDIPLSQSPDAFDRAVLKKTLNAVMDSVIDGGKSMYAIDDLFRDHQRIHRVHVLATVPWISYRAREGSTAFENVEKVTEQLVSMMLTDSDEAGSVMVDRTIHDLKINGYPVSPERYFGHSAKRISVGYVDAYMDIADYNDVNQILQNSLGIESEDISWVSGLSVLHHNSFANYDHPFPDYRMLLLNSHGIEEFIVSDGNIVTHSHTRFGKSYFLDQLVKDRIAVSRKEARSLLSSYLDGHLEEQLVEKFESITRKMLAQLQPSSESATFVLAEKEDILFFNKAVRNNNLINLSAGKEVNVGITSASLAAFYQYLRW